MLKGILSLPIDDLRWNFAVVLRLTISFVWLVAAVEKARTPIATRDAVRRLLGIPSYAVPIMALMLPLVEALLGVLLLIPVYVRIVATTSAALFVLFGVLIARAAIRDSLAGGGCGCFGAPSAARENEPGSAAHAIGRNFVLATLAVGAAIGG